jgi:hypothetical protein
MENGKNDPERKLSVVNQETGDNLLGNVPSVDQWDWRNCGPYSNPVPAPRMDLKECLQGCVDDCHFIAALAAVAWAAQAQLSTNPLNYIFYKTNPPKGNIPINLATQNVPAYRAGPYLGTPIFAGSTTGETWPSLYEKAYAKFLGLGSVDGDPDHINIGGIGPGSGTTAVINITRWQYYREWNVAATDIAALNNAVNISPTGKTLYPMVASTENRDGLIAGIYKKHCYAFLGFCNNNQYVVLKNPYGGLLARVGKNVEPNQGVWIPPAGTPAWNTINLSDVTDGIFALDIPTFKANFLTLSRVTQLQIDGAVQI